MIEFDLSKEGGPAFPMTFEMPEGDHTTKITIRGITVRDYFAAAALNHPYCRENLKPGDSVQDIARWAYGLADAMLAERAK